MKTMDSNSTHKPKSYINDRTKLWAKRSAIQFLGTYSSSVDNLRKTIKKRALRKYENISNEEANILANSATDFCIENKFIDDNNYAETKMAAGSRKGHSRSKIKMDLQQKGTDSEAIQVALENVDDFKNALTFAKKKKLGPWRTKELDIKIKQREMSAFTRNMFSFEIAQKILNLELEEAEDLFFST